MEGWGWGAAVFMGMLAALFIALLVWFIVSLAGRRDDTSAPSASPSRARALLDERYARGEIERDEYLQRKADLES
ncbi:MAG: SHOCT domain-containing protein [Gammaproteobacteria bacterium]|nr:SHOCT domain-containing protein [Gammaproteobacteria bacterium]